MRKTVAIPLVLSLVPIILLVVGLSIIAASGLSREMISGPPFEIVHRDADGLGQFQNSAIGFELPDNLYGTYYESDQQSDLKSISTWDTTQLDTYPEDYYFMAFYAIESKGLNLVVNDELLGIKNARPADAEYGNRLIETPTNPILVDTAEYTIDDGSVWRGSYFINDGETVFVYSSTIGYTSEVYRNNAIRQIESIVESTRVLR